MEVVAWSLARFPIGTRVDAANAPIGLKDQICSISKERVRLMRRLSS
ncbi:hypothetical protein [Kitasatospora sp. NPDC098663]